MQFTGTDLIIKRNFFTQTGNFGFVVSCVVDNTSGLYQFGLSGAAGVQEFSLRSGKIYYGNTFIHSYHTSQSFDLAANLYTGSINIIKDGAALAYNLPHSTGNYDYFYFKRANAGMGATFDLEISGDNAATYAIQQVGYLLSSGQNAVTGHLTNTSAYPIRIFDSSIQATQNYSFGKLAGNLGAAASGNFAYSGDFSTIDVSQPILTTFNANFGDASILFNIIDARTLSRFIYLTGPTDFSFNQTGVLNRDATYLNYSGGLVTSNFNSSLVFQLRYGTGFETFTGIWNMMTGADSSSLVSFLTAGQFSSGLMSGSGIFAANSLVNFQVTYSGVSGNSAYLVISGNEVLNPVNQLLSN